MEVSRVPIPVDSRAPDGRTNAYLLGGDATLLVDPAGRSEELSALLRDSPPDHVAVTHTHRDHVGAVSAYAERFESTVWAFAGFEDRFVEATGRTPDRTFQGGDRVGPTVALPTPGHAADHVAFDLGEEALVGDLAVAEGSVFVGGQDGDLKSYLTSLERLRTRSYDRLHPAHGPVIHDPATTLQRLIDHRLDRERRVRRSVEAGAETVGAIVDAAYDKDLTGVRDLAALAVEAHLEKLGDDGEIHWDGDRARPR